MSNTPDKANIERLKKISQKISAIFKNCENGIDQALMDETWWNDKNQCNFKRLKLCKM